MKQNLTWCCLAMGSGTVEAKASLWGSLHSLYWTRVLYFGVVILQFLFEIFTFKIQLFHRNCLKIFTQELSFPNHKPRVPDDAFWSPECHHAVRKLLPQKLRRKKNDTVPHDVVPPVCLMLADKGLQSGNTGATLINPHRNLLLQSWATSLPRFVK